MDRRSLRVFVLAVVGAAALVLALLPAGGLVASPWTVGLLGAVAALLGTRPVTISALRTRITTTHPFELIAMAAFGPLAGGVVSIAAVVGATAGHDRRPDPVRMLFNLGVMVLSISSASLAFFILGGRPGDPVLGMLWPLTGATAAYFVCNTGLVAAAIALEKSRGFLATWRGSFQWTAVSFFSGLTLAVVLLLLLQGLGPWALALGIPPAWLLLAFHRAYKERLEEQRRRIEEIEALNAELELKVAGRTRELQEALARIEDANQRLRETNQRLIEANRAKSEFLANVSHELRTPLNGILGFSDLLMDASFGELAGQQRDFVADIRDSGEHLLELINDILDLSKIEAGKMQVHRQRFEVRDTVRDVVSMMRSLAAKKRIALGVELGSGVGVADLDRGMFRQILFNLLSNAVKFTPADGRVTVAARVRDPNDLDIEVRDTGIGIRPEDQSKIFQEFFQVDGSYSRQYQGTGLGLALVKRMAELHGGSVAVESGPGKGSRFTCVFPGCVVAESPEHRRAGPRPVVAEPRAGRERTILLVEDNELNRKLARNALRSKAYRVLEAATGEQALEMARSSRPDLVLMDLQLPGMDGLEVTRRLKADPVTAHIRIVAISAFVQHTDQERAREAGCVGYITKPIRLSTFPSQIESCFLPQEGVA